MPPKAGRSRVQEVHRDRLRFAYRTQTDDGNPTYVDWTGEISPDGGGARVDVRWEARLTTLGRRPQLSREVPATLAAISTIAARRSTV